MPHSSDNIGDDLHPERRGGDEHTREIVKMAVHEIFDTLSIDIASPHGRQRFRDNWAFLDDARKGTGTVKKTLLGAILIGVGGGIWKLIAAGAIVLGRGP